jgi:antirestriction protein ArdC
MTNLKKFRENYFLQQEYALATGRTVAKLLERSEGLNGNTQFNSFLQQTQSSSSPISWLEEELCLNASIHGLKQSAKEITELEQWLDFSYPDILFHLAHKHSTTPLEKIFDCEPSEDWGNVTKGDIKPLLEEFHWWCSFINELDLHEHDFEAAQDLLAFLEQPLFKQLRRLVDVVELANWELDAGVFENIITGLNNNNKNFVQEWLSSVNAFSHYNAKSHREYKSLHSWLFLSLIAQAYGYKSNFWATKQQWKKLGCELKEDAKPAPVFHYFKVEHENEFAHEEEERKAESSFGRKISIVYNADQVIGFEGECFAETKVSELPVLERRIDELNIHIEHSNGGAAYNRIDDYISMPHKELFKAKDSTKAYYATLLHEMVHWTGHESRCKRTFGKSYDDPAYAFEELVAEIGSSFLCARFGLTKEVRANSIKYIASWLDGFDDKQWIKTLEKSATLANRASNVIYVPKRDD